MSDELDERSKERIEIEYLFVGHNFPNTEIVDRIQNWVNKKVIEALDKAYWAVDDATMRRNGHYDAKEAIEALKKKS